MNKTLFFNRTIFLKYSIVDLVEISLRLWMGYILIINSGVGTITPLEELGLPEHIYKIIKGMWDTGFMMHLVKAIELLGGVLLILNIFIPIALIALLPVVINIYGVHIFLFNSYFTNGLYMLLIILFLIFRYKKTFLPLLKLNNNK
jgi:hypothetical protein